MTAFAFAHVTATPTPTYPVLRLALGATPPLPPAAGLPLPQPLGDVAQAAAGDRLVATLTYALVLDARCTPVAGPAPHYRVTTLAGDFAVTMDGTAYRCTCPQATADGGYTPATLTTSCAHVLLLLWLQATPTTQARWGACYPALAAAWHVYSARRLGHIHQPGTLAALATQL